MKAEIMLPLMAMILQAGILPRQNDMLQRQNDLISEIQTRLNEREEKLSAPDAALATVHTEIKQTSRLPPSPRGVGASSGALRCLSSFPLACARPRGPVAHSKSGQGPDPRFKRAGGTGLGASGTGIKAGGTGIR